MQKNTFFKVFYNYISVFQKIYKIPIFQIFTNTFCNLTTTFSIYLNQIIINEILQINNYNLKCKQK